MPFNRPTEKSIASWPPKEPVRQVTKAELAKMTPEAINQAREAGALEDLLKGRKPPPEAPTSPPRSGVGQ